MVDRIIKLALCGGHRDCTSTVIFGLLRIELELAPRPVGADQHVIIVRKIAQALIENRNRGLKIIIADRAKGIMRRLWRRVHLIGRAENRMRLAVHLEIIPQDFADMAQRRVIAVVIGPINCLANGIKPRIAVCALGAQNPQPIIKPRRQSANVGGAIQRLFKIAIRRAAVALGARHHPAHIVIHPILRRTGRRVAVEPLVCGGLAFPVLQVEIGVLYKKCVMWPGFGPLQIVIKRLVVSLLAFQIVAQIGKAKAKRRVAFDAFPIKLLNLFQITAALIKHPGARHISCGRIGVFFGNPAPDLRA